MKTVKQPRALRTRDKILGEAARLFALKGYHDTKLEEILTAAQVTTGAFFHHFRSKEELGFVVLDRHMEKRRQLLERIEKRLPLANAEDALAPLFRRLDAIREMVRQRQNRKGGCIIGNLSVALSGTHDRFRRRLAECFDEMALEFKPYLDAAWPPAGARRRPNTWELARYIVALIEGAIMLMRTHRDGEMLDHQFTYLKDYLRQLQKAGSS